MKAVFDLTSGALSTSIMVQLGTWIQSEGMPGSHRGHSKPELFLPVLVHLWGHHVGEAVGRTLADGDKPGLTGKGTCGWQQQRRTSVSPALLLVYQERLPAPSSSLEVKQPGQAAAKPVPLRISGGNYLGSIRDEGENGVHARQSSSTRQGPSFTLALMAMVAFWAKRDTLHTRPTCPSGVS